MTYINSKTTPHSNVHLNQFKVEVESESEKKQINKSVIAASAILGASLLAVTCSNAVYEIYTYLQTERFISNLKGGNLTSSVSQDGETMLSYQFPSKEKISACLYNGTATKAQNNMLDTIANYLSKPINATHRLFVEQFHNTIEEVITKVLDKNPFLLVVDKNQVGKRAKFPTIAEVEFFIENLRKCLKNPELARGA